SVLTTRCIEADCRGSALPPRWQRLMAWPSRARARVLSLPPFCPPVRLGTASLRFNSLDERHDPPVVPRSADYVYWIGLHHSPAAPGCSRSEEHPHLECRPFCSY